MTILPHVVGRMLLTNERQRKSSNCTTLLLCVKTNRTTENVWYKTMRHHQLNEGQISLWLLQLALAPPINWELFAKSHNIVKLQRNLPRRLHLQVATKSTPKNAKKEAAPTLPYLVSTWIKAAWAFAARLSPRGEVATSQLREAFKLIAINWGIPLKFQE